MKCLVGVLALSAAVLAIAEPEADPEHYSAFPPYLARPYYASGYVSPLPGHSYQAVHRLHRREAEPQFVVGPPAPYTAAVLPAAVHAIGNVPFVKSVVEIPASVISTHHHTPFSYAAPLHYQVAPQLHHYAPAALHHPVTYAAAPVPVAAGHTVVTGLSAHDCVTEAGCALRTALLTGAPAATYGSASVQGRKRRDADAEPEAESDADAEAEADPFHLYNNAYNGYYGAFPYSLPYNNLHYNNLPYNNLPYNNLPYNHLPYNPLAYLNNYYAADPAIAVAEAAYSVVPYVGAATVEVEAPHVLATPAVAAPHIAAPYVAAPHVVAPYVAAPHVAAPYVAAPHVVAPYVAAPHVAAPYVAAALPQVHTVAKEVTYTHLGAHPISPTTVLQTESKLVY